MKSAFYWITRSIGLVLLLVALVGAFRLLKWMVGFSRSAAAHVRVIELNGMILSSRKVNQELEDAEKEDSVKAVVLRINSPGGLVAPSQEIFEAVKRLDKKKPVIVSMESLAASGGYYSALGGRKIYANSGTLTASIGVIIELANTQKLYQWAKVERFALKTGRYKDTGSPFRTMEPDERELMTKMLQNINSQFRAAVMERRHLKEKDLENVADGRVMTGAQALEAKLVDQLGTEFDAIAEAKVLAKLPADSDVEYNEERPGLLRRMILGEESSANRFFARLDRTLTQVVPSINPQGYRVWYLAPIEY